MVETATAIDNELRGVLLPLQQTNLLLPNVTVAEVIGFRETDTVENAPDWLLGSITWRQRKIPVIAFEYFLGKPVNKIGYRARIALCYNLLEKPRMPYMGILCDSIPRLARVSSDTVELDHTEASLPKMTLQKLAYNNEEAWIPDLDALASAASGYLFKE